MDAREQFDFAYAVKKEYYDQLKCKLSTYRKMDEYISSCIYHICPTASHVPSDIIRIILLFFMYDVSKYEYIAIFTVKDSTPDTIGHLSAFNVTNRSRYHKSHSLLQQQHRCDIDAINSNLFKEVYGASFRVFLLNRFPASIRDNLFPKYTKVIGSDLNLHTLFRIESTFESTLKPITASLIETDDQIHLSKGIRSNILDRCDLIQSPIHGLIALGGKSSTVFVLEWNEDTKEFEWNSNKIAPMKVSRYNHRSVFLDGDDRIFCCGGNAGSTSVEMYEFESNTWTEIKSMHVARDCHGCIYDNVNKCVYALAAYDEYKSCEKYDFVKNDWLDLPSLNNTHRWHPPVKMLNNHNVLMVAGDFYKYDTGWGCCEYLDLRDSVNKWVLVDTCIPKALNFDPELINYRNKYMRGLWYLFM